MAKDYKRAFYIACELLNGTNFYGIDTDKIYEICMREDGVVSGSSYRDYILNHLDEIDHGEYKSLIPVIPVNPFVIDDLCKSDWKSTYGSEIPKKGEAVLVSTFGITTMAWVVSEPSEKLKFTVLDPISHRAVYDPLDKYQVRKWMPLPKGD